MCASLQVILLKQLHSENKESTLLCSCNGTGVALPGRTLAPCGKGNVGRTENGRILRTGMKYKLHKHRLLLAACLFGGEEVRKWNDELRVSRGI
jgi:hypothetical protein